MAPKGSPRWAGRLTGVEVGELAGLLGIQVDAEALAICCRLLEQGANPEALAALVAELQREARQRA